MKTFGSLFTGFDGVGIGAQQAGLELAWGLELRPDVAEVANGNLGNHVRVGNLLDEDPYNFDRVDVLHASPPCPNFSAAKTNGAETALDIALAKKTAEFVTVLRPEIFTLENVMAYRQSKSWALIQDALFSAGYWVTIDIVNMADHGVPQSRKRMIVRAVRGGWVPYLSQADRQIGWYEAIEDLIPTLPESQFAPWQLKRLPSELSECLVGVSGYDGGVVIAERDEPANTITARHNQLMLRAFIVDCQNGAASKTKDRGLTIRAGDEPMFTLTASMGQKRPTRAWADGRIVAMTPRALARFQTFPDWYEFDCTRTLAAYGIGNAVPCEFARRMYAGLKEREQ